MKGRTFDLPAGMSTDKFLREIHFEGVRETLIAKFIVALHLAEIHHKGQTRNNGDTRYVEHVLVVAYGLYRLGFEFEVIIAALLHDIVEDSEMSSDDVRRNFGDRVCRIVAALTKDENHKEMIFEQMYQGTVLDYEVIFVKLLDRWHNLVTSYGLRTHEQQVRFLEETVNEMGELLVRCKPLIPENQTKCYDWLCSTVTTLAESKIKVLLAA